MLHLPVLRGPTAYRSIDTTTLVDVATGEPVAEVSVSWDQPHEGNLFEHLYRQRSFQTAEAESAA